MDLFHKLSLDYDQNRLQSIYLNNWDMPPNTLNKDVLMVGSRQFLIVSLLRDDVVDWGFDDFFIDKGLSVKETVIYISGPQTIGRPHLDVCKTDTINEWALNVPIFNGTSGRTVWYDSKTKVYGKTVNGNLVGMLSEDKAYECEEVADLVMDSPYIVRTNHLHTVENNDNKWRVNLSFRFKDTSWKDAKEKLL
tara:strand:- start:315 stop:893 length:579 start_codon:yes stop_codon:yes gene_type:complete